jgi:hypothetical protein
LAGSGLPARHVFLAGSLNLKRLGSINMIEPAKKQELRLRDSRLTNWRAGKNLSIERLKNP